MSSSTLTRMFGFAKRFHSSSSVSPSETIISIYCNVCNKGYHEPAIIRVSSDGKNSEYSVKKESEKKYKFSNIKDAPVHHYTYN